MTISNKETTMAKDILVNTNTGDFITPEHDAKASYWEVVWGKLFETDTMEYMNIIVPDWYLGHIRYVNDEFVCQVHADYNPSDEAFQARFVVSYDDDYTNAIELDSNVIHPVTVVYYPNTSGESISIMASQLPMVDINGYFKLLFKRYVKGNFEYAVIYQSEDSDFKTGDSDDQSAQLLARCAPGSYYRFPGLGVDLTKYINSVVDHTQLIQSLVDEFKSDSKTIIEAEFNNANGDLNVVFSGTREANDTNLTDPDLLDVELFQLADDDYVRVMAQAANGIKSDNVGFIQDLISQSELIGIWDIGCECELTKLESTTTHANSVINMAGEIVTDNEAGQYIAESEVETGTLYAFDYKANNAGIVTTYSTSDSDSARKSRYYQNSSLLATKTSPAYVHPIVDTQLSDEYYRILNDLQIRRRCFIPLQNVTIVYAIGGNSKEEPTGDVGIRKVSNVAGNYKSLLGLFVHPVTSKLFGIVSVDSEIEDILIDFKTQRLLIIK